MLLSGRTNGNNHNPGFSSFFFCFFFFWRNQGIGKQTQEAKEGNQAAFALRLFALQAVNCTQCAWERDDRFHECWEHSDDDNTQGELVPVCGRHPTTTSTQPLTLLQSRRSQTICRWRCENSATWARNLFVCFLLFSSFFPLPVFPHKSKTPQIAVLLSVSFFLSWQQTTNQQPPTKASNPKPDKANKAQQRQSTSKAQCQALVSQRPCLQTWM